MRKRIRRERAAIDTQLRQTWDSAINRQLLEHVTRTNPRVVAAFVAFDGEPDLAPALAQLEHRGTRLALPVIVDEPTRPAICFRQWSAGSAMKPNRYGIPEPAGTLDLRLDELDLVLIPLVAWDPQGGRLGMGASFYDRAFQPFVDLKHPFRLGIGYQLQEAEHIPLDPWDIRLHGVLTENGCFTCPF